MTAKEILARIDQTRIYPPFLERVVAGLEQMIARGEEFWATSGMRTFEQQDALYAQGRTKPGKICTKAPGGFSAHQYGAAVDFCRDADLVKPGLQPDYNRVRYTVLAEEMELVGLEAGLRWVSISDAPHVQIPLKLNNITWPMLVSVHKTGGLAAVWQIFDRELDWRKRQS